MRLLKSSVFKYSSSLIILLILIFISINGLSTSVFGKGDSGESGSGGSAGSDPGGGGSNGGGDPNEGSSNGGDPTNGGSGGGSNQNNSGDEGNNNGGEEGSGSMGNCSLARVVKTVVGYVYLDANQNNNFDLTLTAPDGRKDSGLAGQLIEIYMAAYTVPAHTVPGWEEVTGTDENGTPTGSVWHEPVFVPEEYHPEIVFARVATDELGHYTTQVPMSNNYHIRHIPGGIEGFTRVSPQSDSVAANISCDFTQSFGVYLPSSNSTPTPSSSSSTVTSPPPTSVPSPSPSASVPPVYSTAPIVSIAINGQQNGSVPAVEVTQNPTSQASLTWQISNTPDNTCLASAAKTDGSTAPADINAIWNGPKGPPPTSGGPVAIPTNTSGKYLFSLICTNSAGTTSATIQLNVNQYPPAYFQTTGGDVHSNQNIHISQ